MKRIAFELGLGLSLLACSRVEEEQKSSQYVGKEITFTAYVEENDAKTELQSGGSVYWCPGDAVSLFFNSGDNGGNCFVAQNSQVSAKADFKGTITAFAGGGESTGGEFWFWGIYPYSEQNSCDGKSVTLNLPDQQAAKGGSFASGVFPTMARAKGLELAFYNICSGFKFTVLRSDIRAVKFRGNAGESIAGKAKIEWDANGHPAVVEHLAGSSEVMVTAPGNGTFVPGTEYYISVFPELLSKGFTMTFITADAKQGSYVYSKSRQLKRGVFTNCGSLDPNINTWTDVEDPSGLDPVGDEGGSESGLYFGMSTFERNLTYYPTHLMAEETLSSYNEIVDNLKLTDLNGTVLYYSIDEDITSMKGLSLPKDLFNVSIVTFTDGIDEGSLAYRRGVYKTKAEYLEALHNRLENEKVSGLPIKSYAIGLKSTDAQSNLQEFQNNLKKIASTSTNSNEKYSYEISSMNELNSTFESIANQLSQKILVQKVVFSIPFPEDGERKRFTLDGKTPAQSSKYIDGVFDMDKMCLYDLTYKGIESTSGSTVAVSADNGFDLEFTFDGIQTSDGTEINKQNIQLWEMSASGSSWQLNREFSPDRDSKVYTEQKSALVLLNLDLSKSMEGQLSSLKSGVKSFLSKLYTASVDPNVIKKVTLNKTEMDLAVGLSETLQLTVSPSTASTASLKWVSSLPSVATVNSSGKVTAVSEGATVISVKNEEDKVLATCTVRVIFKKIESITLNKSSLNIYVGGTASLSATILPSDASNQELTWSSSNTKVATVSQSGVVTGVGKGSATIKASAKDGSGLKASCSVVVNSLVTSVTLNMTSASMKVGETLNLTATVKPDDASNKTVTWSTSDAAIATVSGGVVTAKKIGVATIKATSNDGSGKYAECSVKVMRFPDAVDLGLSVKWASFNIGASTPEDYGAYYAWGEIEPKLNYLWNTYKWCKGSSTTLTKYNNSSSYGTVDSRTELTTGPEGDDIASRTLGGNWRMPTDAEWTELRTKCTWTWKSSYNGTGVSGRLVTASNGNSIFLPAAGYRDGTSLNYAGSRGYYWSSSLNTGSPDDAWDVYINSGGGGRSNDYRCLGRSVRPVTE